jgi:Uncharacterized protein conserved in bacteria
MLLFILLGITTGGFIPLQTSINSQLRNRVKTPFLSSLISFLVGTIFLIDFKCSNRFGHSFNEWFPIFYALVGIPRWNYWYDLSND